MQSFFERDISQVKNQQPKECQQDGWSLASTMSLDSSEFHFMDPKLIADKIDNFDTILLCLQQVRKSVKFPQKIESKSSEIHYVILCRTNHQKQSAGNSMVPIIFRNSRFNTTSTESNGSRTRGNVKVLLLRMMEIDSFLMRKSNF